MITAVDESSASARRLAVSGYLSTAPHHDRGTRPVLSHMGALAIAAVPRGASLSPGRLTQQRFSASGRTAIFGLHLSRRDGRVA